MSLLSQDHPLTWASTISVPEYRKFYVLNSDMQKYAQHIMLNKFYLQNPSSSIQYIRFITKLTNPLEIVIISTDNPLGGGTKI